MPVVTKNDFIELKPGEIHKIIITFKINLNKDDSWRYTKTSMKSSWRAGDIKLKKGIYKINCNFNRAAWFNSST